MKFSDKLNGEKNVRLMSIYVDIIRESFPKRIEIHLLGIKRKFET